jgi:hypothetical protein
VADFIQKVSAGDMEGALELVSAKAKGNLLVLKKGEAQESQVDELKKGLTGAKFLTSKNVGARKLVVYENTESQKIQFFVASDGGRTLIVEMNVR